MSLAGKIKKCDRLRVISVTKECVGVYGVANGLMKIKVKLALRGLRHTTRGFTEKNRT